MAGRHVGVGIIGMRTIGATHARALRQCDGVAEVRAVSGGGAGAAARAGWPDAREVAPDDVLAAPDVDVVVVCTPSETHADYALAAIDAGKHVVVEKPIAVDVAGAEKVAAAAASSGLVVSAMAQRRFEPEHRYVKALLDAGDLGRVVLGETYVHWHRDDAYYASAAWRTSMRGGGGSLMNQGLHNVDLLQWLLGPVVEVTAQYATLGHQMDAEDTTVATLRFASGALGVVVTSTATPPGAPAELAIHAEAGRIVLSQDGIRQWDVPAAPPPEHTLVASGAADPGAIGIVGHLTQWRDVLDAIRAGHPPEVSAADAAATVRLLCAIYEAGRTGRRVRLADLR